VILIDTLQVGPDDVRVNFDVGATMHLSDGTEALRSEQTK